MFSKTEEYTEPDYSSAFFTKSTMSVSSSGPLRTEQAYWPTTSPPVTPKARQSSPAVTAYPTPHSKGMGLPPHSPSPPPPLEHIRPIGQGPQFSYTRRHLDDYSSRPSSVSGLRNASSPPLSVADSDRYSRFSGASQARPVQVVKDGNFRLEEMDDEDIGYDSNVEVVRPDAYEEAHDSADEDETMESSSSDAGISKRFSQMHCDEDDAAWKAAQERRYKNKKKRWSSGIFKRTHSQSVGSDTDPDDPDSIDAHDVESSARRLRRRVRGPESRSSLIFEDLPNNILEAEEHVDVTASGQQSSTLQSTQDGAMAALPYWVLEDPMSIDSDSSYPPSR